MTCSDWTFDLNLIQLLSWCVVMGQRLVEGVSLGVMLSGASQLVLAMVAFLLVSYQHGG